MKQRLLGGVLPVSAVAMGCMRLCDAKEDPDRVIGTALENGIDCFDHADIYGGGRCEALFGDWLAATGSRSKQSAASAKAAMIFQKNTSSHRWKRRCGGCAPTTLTCCCCTAPTR